MRGLAVRLTRSLRHKDFTGEARYCLDYCRDNMRYVKDIRGLETLHTCDVLMDIGAGDCDDKAIMLAALLLSIGHKPRFIAIALEPDNFCHVWVQDYIKGEWVDLEPTEPIPFGSSVPYQGRATDVLTLEA